jgi:hypothetical protein
MRTMQGGEEGEGFLVICGPSTQALRYGTPSTPGAHVTIAVHCQKCKVTFVKLVF